MHPVILKEVNKTYHLDSVGVPALCDINLEIRSNRFTVISGPSGSGKTTLLNVIGCIDRPDRGEVLVAGQDVQKMSDNALSDFRAHQLGFIFQNFNLLQVLTAYENVEYPLLLTQMPDAQRKQRVLALLDAVGLADRAQYRPGQLSGGQRQRVAIALMRKMQREHNVSFVFSSHDPQVQAAADDTVFIRDGRITSVERLTDPTEVAA